MNSKFRILARKPRQFLHLDRATIAKGQGASEDQKFAAKLTQSKPSFEFICVYTNR